MHLIKKLNIYYMLIAVIILTACSQEQDNPKQDNNMNILKDTTPFTIIIPSVTSNQKLRITLPRCHFGKLEDNEVNGSEFKGFTLIFPMASLSNNEQEKYSCPLPNEPSVRLTIWPLFPYPGEKELQFGNYWQKTDDRGAGVIEQNNDIQVYLTSPNRLSVFTNQSKQNLEDYKLTFIQDPKTLGGFADHLDIFTVFKEEFSLQYTVLSSNLIHDKRFPYPKFKTNPWFADKLIEIYSNQDSISNHPKVLEAFTQNNNRIVEYFYKHSEIIQGE